MKEYLKGFYYWFGATWGIMCAISSCLIITSITSFIKGFIKGLFGF